MWRKLSKPTSLVSRFLKSIYFRDSNILKANQGRNPSNLWKSLLWGRDLLAKGLRNRIGNGDETKMFNDPWIPKENSFKPICINRELINRKVSDFILPNGTWDVEKLSGAVVYFDCDIIRGVPINKNLSDKIIWHFDKTGEYTVKSRYKLYMKLKIDGIQSSSSHTNKIWNNVWRMEVPSKIKHFVWKALNNVLPNNCNFLHRGIEIPPNCPMCNFRIESTDHILFGCDRAKKIWELTHNRVSLEEEFNDSFIDRWCKIDSQSSLEELGLVAATCWAIWEDINKFVHGEEIPQSI